MQIIDIITAELRRVSGAERIFADAHARALWALGLDDAQLEREVDAALGVARDASRQPRPPHPRLGSFRRSEAGG